MPEHVGITIDGQASGELAGLSERIDLHRIQNVYGVWLKIDKGSHCHHLMICMLKEAIQRNVHECVPLELNEHWNLLGT